MRKLSEDRYQPLPREVFMINFARCTSTYVTTIDDIIYVLSLSGFG